MKIMKDLEHLCYEEKLRAETLQLGGESCIGSLSVRTSTCGEK